MSKTKVLGKHYEVAREEEKKSLLRVSSEGFFDADGQNITRIKNNQKCINRLGKPVFLKRYLDEYHYGVQSSDKVRSKPRVLYGDIETTKEPDGTRRAWYLGLYERVNNSEKFYTCTSIEEYMEFIKRINHGTIYYYHLKYDLSYMMDYALREMGQEQVFEHKKKRANTFMLHRVDGKVYSITWVISKNNSKERPFNEITMIDGAKLLPGGLKGIGQAFKTDGIGKVKVDQDFHTRYRPVGNVPTREEEEYLYYDCKVLADGIENMLSDGHERKTIASCSMQFFKDLFNKNEKHMFSGQKDPKYNFINHFPKIPLSICKHLFESYMGGWCYVNPKYKGKDIERGICFDVNSLYPFVMRTKLLPFGKPHYFEGNYHDQKGAFKKKHPLFIQGIIATGVLKKGHVATLSTGTEFARVGKRHYTQFINEVFYLTHIDLELLKKHYHITESQITYIDGYAFEGKTGMFDEYIDFWIEEKKKHSKNGTEPNEGARFIDKLFLTSLYGKFGARSDNNAQKVELFDDLPRYSPITKHHSLLSEEEKEQKHLKESVYVPLASYVTAYAREITVNAVQGNFERFIYADTDSLHLVGAEYPTNIPIDHQDTGDLGLWKFEYEFLKGRYLRAKTYCNHNGEKGDPDRNHFYIVVAGMGEEVKKHVTWENFYEWNRKYPNGHDRKPNPEKGEVFCGQGIYWGQLAPVTVVGGIDLQEGWFSIVAFD